MRTAYLVGALAIGLSGCQQVVVALPVADLAAVTVDGGNQGDAVASAPAGYHCSVFWWAVGKHFCKPVEAVPLRPQYCTRSLARVDCWDRPDPFGYHQRQVADGPWQLTPEQEWNRTASWPYR